MSTLARCTALVASLLISMQLCAAPAAVVEGVQMPAWLEREGSRTPLNPGMELKPGDRLQSGGGARILVRLVEGSTVKLGENGTLVLESLDPAKELFKAALRVLAGAFRFTTDVAARSRKRDVSVRIQSVTAGIRGTDLWGRSRSDQQIVCLLEGAVEVGAEGETPVTLDQPLQFYQRLQGSTQPVGFIEKKQLDQWARETEIEHGKVGERRGSRQCARRL